MLLCVTSAATGGGGVGLSVARAALFPSTAPQFPFFPSPKTLAPRRLPNPRSYSPSPPLRPVLPEDSPSEASADAASLEGSAAAVAAAIRRASPDSVEFTQHVVERAQEQSAGGLVLPSPDFRRLCVEQLELFRLVVDHRAVLSVYVRPAGSYVMDQLELRRVVTHPANDISDSADCVILMGTFSVAAGLRTAEAALTKQQGEVIPEFSAVVMPMVKHPFVVGFLVAELPIIDWAPHSDEFKLDVIKADGLFTSEQITKAAMISRSLATAYVMDQKAMLLQQSSWQNSVRMSHLIEQIRGPLSTIRALTKMMSVHVKKIEISHDIVEDILMQGDNIKDTLQQLQEAVYITKANIVSYDDEKLKKLRDPLYGYQESFRSLPSDYSSTEYNNYSVKSVNPLLSLDSGKKDIARQVPPVRPAPNQRHGIGSYSVTDVLKELVAAATPLANMQQRSLEFCELPNVLQVPVEESALRQALSNLIEGALLRTQIGGKVQIYATGAPAGGSLIVIDDDGPDMHYMTQTHSLTPFGAELLADGMAEDNMAWNFVAGLAVAREILESHGCIVRVISPRKAGAALGNGGTRIELWFTSLQSDLTEAPHHT